MTKQPIKMLAYISGGVLQDVLIEGDDDAAYELEVIDADEHRSTVWWLTAQPADEYETAAENYRVDLEENNAVDDLCQ